MLSYKEKQMLAVEAKIFAVIDAFIQCYDKADSAVLTLLLLTTVFERNFSSEACERVHHRLQHHWVLCKDVCLCEKREFLELSVDEGHRAFRRSVVQACGDGYRVNGWRKRVRRAARDVTCAILLDDFFYL